MLGEKHIPFFQIVNRINLEMQLIYPGAVPFEASRLLASKPDFWRERPPVSSGPARWFKVAQQLALIGALVGLQLYFRLSMRYGKRSVPGVPMESQAARVA